MASLTLRRKRRSSHGKIRRGSGSARPFLASSRRLCLSRRLEQALDSAFTMIEVLLAVAVIGVIAAMAIPQAFQAVKAYRLHADATALADQLNLARMRAASQFSPYRAVISTGSGSYWREKLCGDTLSTVDTACTLPYNALTTPDIESGTQYAFEGDEYLSCRPSVVGGSTYPGTIKGDPSPCPDPLEIYFNTRGMPVDSSGNPLGNGGAVIYIRNQNNLVDAVTVAIGGAVAIWNWDPASGAWEKR